MSHPDVTGAAPEAGRSAGTSNLSHDSLALFERSWQSYHRVVAEDLMEHAGLVQAMAGCLGAFLADWGPGPLAMADLACGDLTTLEPLLRSLPLTAFMGLDAAATALPLARTRMAGWSVPCEWVQDDLLHWAGQPGERYAVISCLFGLHHLDDRDKQRFLDRVGGRLAGGGLLLIGDLFREPGEERPAYVERYVRRIRQQWSALERPLQDHVVDHLMSSDYPAASDTFTAMAAAAGWQCRWIWRGSHQAEALLALQANL